MKYKIYEVPDDFIDNAVDKLGISIEEACQLWEEDHSKNDTPEQQSLTQKAKAEKIKNVGRKITTTHRKTTRQPDKDKVYIMQALVSAVTTLGINVNTKSSHDFSFCFNNEEFTVKIIKHRKKT